MHLSEEGIVLFDLILYVPSTIFQWNRDGPSWGPQRSDAGEARTRGLSVSNQALYHWAPKKEGIVRQSDFSHNSIDSKCSKIIMDT